MLRSEGSLTPSPTVATPPIMPTSLPPTSKPSGVPTVVADPTVTPTAVLPTFQPSGLPTLKPLSVERPPVIANVTSECMNAMQIYVVDIQVNGAGGNNGTRTVPIEVAFALDSSGSMRTNDPNGIRKTASIEFVDKLDKARDLGAVVSWGDTILFSTNLTNDFEFLKDEIRRVDDLSATDLDVGLDASITILEDFSSLSASARAIIFLTDGDGTYTTCAQNGPASLAATRGYKIYSVGLGSSVDTFNLIDIANCTGGMYTLADSADDLTGVFTDLFGEVLESTAPFDVTVNLVLQPNFNVIAGSFNASPDSNIFDPVSGKTTLLWNKIDGGRGLSSGQSFEIKFAVTALSSGSLTDQLASSVTFSTQEGDIGEVPTPALFIDIASENSCETNP